MTARAGSVQAEPTAPGPSPLQVARLLQLDTYRAYWIGRLLTQTAQGALLYGLLILIVDRTDRGIFGSIFVLCSIIPSLVLGLLGGYVADRMPARAFMVSLNVVRALLVASLLRANADLPTIFLVTLGIWIVHQFFSPTEAALLARVTPPDRLSYGTSLSNLALTLAQVLGMVILAPLLLKLPDERFLFGVCAGLYLAGAAAYARIGRLSARDERVVRRQTFALRRGWQFALDDRPSFTALINEVLMGIGLATLVVIVPYYLESVLDTSAGNTVFVFAPAVLGLVIGLQFAPWIGRAIGPGRMSTIGLTGFLLVIAAFGLIDQVVALLREAQLPLGRIEASLGLSTRTSATMLLSVPAGFCSALTSVGARTVLLDRAPEGLRGQVLATQGVLGNAGALLPTLLAGLAIDVVGVRPVALLIALLLAAIAIASRVAGTRHEARTAREWSTPNPNVLPSDARMVQFVHHVQRLKDLRRQGWLDRGVQDPESVADHSWSVAFLAWLLARDRPDLERERVLVLGLVHDLPEVVAGDSTPFDGLRELSGDIPREYFLNVPEYSPEAKRAKSQAEAAALEQLLRPLPAALARDIRQAWEEYDAGETPEARFVRQVDKLETLLQAEAYRQEQPGIVVDSFWLGAKRDITDPRLVRIMDAIGRRAARR
jgi:putative hydrolase of HD superfamily